MRSDRTVYLGVLAPLVLAVALLAGLSVAGFQVLSGVRAYVGGESLWAKARSTAVEQLRAYAVSGQPGHHQRFTAALDVNLGDRLARETLEQPAPDLQAARAGFIRGQNAPDDIDGMIFLYRCFGRSPLMQPAIAAWAEGDRLIAALQALGERVHAQVQAGADVAPLLQELDALDLHLNDAGRRFSEALGQASRSTAALLAAATATLAALLAAAAALFTGRAMRWHLSDRQALLEANKRWELAADADGIGLLDWQIAADRFRLDARACALFDLDPEHADGSSRADLRPRVHLEDQARVRAAWDVAVQQGDPFKNRFRIVCRDGTRRHLEITALVRDSAQPQRARMVGIVRDVTAQVDRAQLLLAKESAERVARARMAFLSRLSHELRTPLNAILGMAQLLLMDQAAPLASPQRKRVQILLDSGQHQLRLVEDVLDLTRIDAGTLAMRIQRCDLRAVLQASLDTVEPEREAFGVRVDDQAPAVLPPVLADPQRLQQVLINLLSNACKYNRRGGRLTLTCDSSAPQVALSVRDQGRGLAAEEMAALFQPFERLQPAADVPGTGLGLVVVKMLVEQMHGSVSVSSEPGHGACFTVWLPPA